MDLHNININVDRLVCMNLKHIQYYMGQSEVLKLLVCYNNNNNILYYYFNTSDMQSRKYIVLYFNSYDNKKILH